MSKLSTRDGARNNRVPSRRLVLGIVAIGVVAIGAIALRAAAGSTHRVTLTTHGTVKVRVLEGDSPAAKDAWSRSEQHGTALPWNFIAVAGLEWSIVGDRPARGQCRQDLIILHPRDWQVTALVDTDFAWGYISSDIGIMGAKHPEILDLTSDSTNPPRVAGTVLSQDSLGARSVEAIEVMWNVPGAKSADVRAAVAIFCGDQLVSFEWLLRRP